MLWYVLVEEMTKVRSIFGTNFSKIVFASYLVFVPPTSLYHMFLEPNLAEAVKVGGSLLSLFISVPTVLVFLVIVVSLEVAARAHGGRGLFGWLRLLPWRNPAMSAIGMAVVNLAIGGALAFVLIQEKFAAMISDTFFIPAYFHFLTVGTVTLTMVAALLYVIPGLTNRPVWRPSVLARLPYVATLGLVLFGGAGAAAGLMGAPRRVFDVTYQGGAPAAWGTLMAIVGVGAAIMASALAIYVYGLARMLVGPSRAARPLATEFVSVAWGDSAAGGAAWTGLIAVAALLVATFGLTVMAFELLEGLPILGAGGH